MNNYNWNLSLIYKDNDQIQNDVKKITELLPKFENEKNSKSINIENLLNLLEEISIILSRLTAYSNMKRDEDTSVSSSQKLVLEIDELSAKTSEILSSFEPTIMKLDEKQISTFFENTKKDDYKQVIQKVLRNKEHILGEKEEYILSVAHDISNDTENSFYMLSYADMKFPLIEKNNTILTHSNFSNMQSNRDRDIRKESFEKMYNTYEKYINTFSANYYGHVKAKEKLAKLRKYQSNLHEELFEDDVDTKVYDVLIESIHEYIPQLSRYMDIKKKYLQLDDLTNYDLYVPIFEQDNNKYGYDYSKELVTNSLIPLGEDYLQILKKGFDENWIDVYPKDNKKSGAYSFGSYDTAPYILLNHTDDLHSVFTLAHELGHSIHSYYSRKNNPYFQSDYTIFVAEVASTTNELLLYNYLLNNTSDENVKKNLMIYNLEQFRTTVFRQTMFAEFEKIVHEKVLNGNAMTADTLNEIYYDLNKKYYPTIKLQDSIAIEWARIPHFYSDFYVYKYATGFISATFLSQNILNNKNTDSYINFLKDGNKNYPIKQLQMAGVDITKKETMKKALDVFKNTIEHF